MKKQLSILSIASLAFIATLNTKAFAEEQVNPAIEYEVTTEADAQDDLRSLVPDNTFDTQDEEALLRDRDGRRDRDWRRDGRRRGGIVIRFPTPFRHACFAQNGRGIVFRAKGFGTARHLQREAMQKCRHNSRNPYSCRPMGCRR